MKEDSIRKTSLEYSGKNPILDIDSVRKDFPIFARAVHGERLVFLDSAASAQKPSQVIRAISECYESQYANVHRGVYWLSEKATEAFDSARKKIGAFLNAPSSSEIVFVRGATEGINLVASSYGDTFLRPGDEVIISHMEHHSNIVPWQILRDQKGIVLKVAPIRDDGSIDIEGFGNILSSKTKFVSMTHVANALGTVVPVEQICKMAHSVGARVLIDGCQAVPHSDVDVQKVGCDFYVFSGHKLYGPSGIGVLYGREELLHQMPPYQGGGDMIESVTFEKTFYADPPQKFEAGTPHISGAIGLGAAVDYVLSIGLDKIAAHEADVLDYATECLSGRNDVRIIGTAANKASVLSFVIDGVHPHDVGTILDQEGIAVRTGHHCAQPVMDRFGVPSTTRASLGMYNGRDDIDALMGGLERVREIFN
ncbi:MAG: cysteine desulfurase [Pseudomonadota bacterium]|nr:cysteine desulfurase [Pseudomonadota bacterium]